LLTYVLGECADVDSETVLSIVKFMLLLSQPPEIIPTQMIGFAESLCSAHEESLVSILFTSFNVGHFKYFSHDFQVSFASYFSDYSFLFFLIRKCVCLRACVYVCVCVCVCVCMCDALYSPTGHRMHFSDELS